MNTNLVKILRPSTWSLWLAGLLALTPAAIGYVGCGAQPSGALSIREIERLLYWKYILEKPGRFLWPELEYPIFWHEHLGVECFWETVIRYFLGNYVAWLIVLFMSTVGFDWIRKLMLLVITKSHISTAKLPEDEAIDKTQET